MCCVWPVCSRETVDQVSDEQRYEDEILAEVVELEAESAEDYQRELAKYRKQLEEWKLSRKKQVPKSSIYYSASLLTFFHMNMQHVIPQMLSDTISF